MGQSNNDEKTNWGLVLVNAVAAIFRNVDRWGWCGIGLLCAYLPAGLNVVAALACIGLWVLLLRSTESGKALRSACIQARQTHKMRKQVAAAFDKLGIRFTHIQTQHSEQGLMLTVHTEVGVPDDAVYSAADAVAATVGAWRVVPVVSERHGMPRLCIQMDDPLEAPVPGPWAVAEADRWDMLNPVPVGQLEDGNEAVVRLWSQTMLVGGSPGAGKSVFGWLPLIAAAKDPTCILIVVDLKPHGIETAPLGTRADYTVHDTKSALDVFNRVWLMIDERNAGLLETMQEKVPVNPQDRLRFPPVMIVVDEAAELKWDEDGKEALKMLQRIVAVGRASGVSVMLLTQKPDGDTIPTALRDNFSQRVCFRVGNREQAQTVLGVLPPDNSVKPWEIKTETPGVGYLKGVGGGTQRFKSAFIDREEVIHQCYIAARERGALMHQKPHGVYVLPQLPPDFEAPDDEAPKKRRRR